MKNNISCLAIHLLTQWKQNSLIWKSPESSSFVLIVPSKQEAINYAIEEKYILKLSSQDYIPN